MQSQKNYIFTAWCCAALLTGILLTAATPLALFADECAPKYSGDPDCPDPSVDPEYLNRYLPQACLYEKLFLQYYAQDPNNRGWAPTGPVGEYARLRYAAWQARHSQYRTAKDLVRFLRRQAESLEDQQSQCALRDLAKRWLWQQYHGILMDCNLAPIGALQEDAYNENGEQICAGQEVCYVLSCADDPDGEGCVAKDMSPWNQLFEKQALRQAALSRAVLRQARPLLPDSALRKLKIYGARTKQKLAPALAAVNQLPDQIGKATLCMWE